ncbi:conserved hypothetical protein [Ricinus communis]|uniref:Uncharacterized protein n=1 Tax=Ricinus communis TaxID=3988 RepID=B9SYR0_RICCO|nr:conserved hypothetical protein [Ricinus communis]
MAPRISWMHTADGLTSFLEPRFCWDACHYPSRDTRTSAHADLGVGTRRESSHPPQASMDYASWLYEALGPMTPETTHHHQADVA